MFRTEPGNPPSQEHERPSLRRHPWAEPRRPAVLNVSEATRPAKTMRCRDAGVLKRLQARAQRERRFRKSISGAEGRASNVYVDSGNTAQCRDADGTGSFINDGTVALLRKPVPRRRQLHTHHRRQHRPGASPARARSKPTAPRGTAERRGLSSRRRQNVDVNRRGDAHRHDLRTRTSAASATSSSMRTQAFFIVGFQLGRGNNRLLRHRTRSCDHQRPDRGHGLRL